MENKVIENFIDNLIKLSLKVKNDITKGITPKTVEDIKEIYILLSQAKEKLLEVKDDSSNPEISKKIKKLKNIIETNQNLINYQLSFTNKIIEKIKGEESYSNLLRKTKLSNLTKVWATLHLYILA